MACLLILNNGHRTAKRSQHLNQTSRAYCYNKHNHGREWSLSDPSERLPLGHTPPPFYPGKGVFPSKHSARHETLGFQCSSNCLLLAYLDTDGLCPKLLFFIFAHCPTSITIIPVFEASHSEVVVSSNMNHCT
ncbi:LOW QUALITY PROTEIN: hypothetical protein CH63R_08645 [Colletotrichum higginsianum IMI 349063]|uniref:Uncharacterized protein n=1 Tax=Colletotrichum higginsianum (strain IMI 349063) TaxID=759273 RepID=A0A1B7Y555_COLHI|nr:LOW QUALITY PROTEIN: hypothetical protein CH63R_08645 [Colletotrichum higginsianum IMI 349063]OBR07124.1 LOW QUALITY PROTEIN: hypothetical protein CH63R_08645 [Colletotrichum higginsianum IMI 349063]